VGLGPPELRDGETNQIRSKVRKKMNMPAHPVVSIQLITKSPYIQCPAQTPAPMSTPIEQSEKLCIAVYILPKMIENVYNKSTATERKYVRREMVGAVDSDSGNAIRWMW
jgi:hypothetical protein